DIRKGGLVSFLRPDSKSQVSIEYINDKPIRVDSVVVSSQHTPDVSYETLKEAIMEE
nr:methionine adenosyltransferase [Desulfuromonadales bacterium]